MLVRRPTVDGAHAGHREELFVTPRAIGTIARTVVAIFGAAVFGALSFAVAAGAQAPAKPSPKVTKPPTQTITRPFSAQKSSG